MVIDMAPKDLAHSRLPLFFFSACGVCYKGHAPQLCSSLFSQTPVKDCEAQDRLALVDLWPAQLSPPRDSWREDARTRGVTPRDQPGPRPRFLDSAPVWGYCIGRAKSGLLLQKA